MTGCIGIDADEEAVAEAAQAEESENALTHNALTHNALTHNALASNALTHNALTHNALTHNALTAEALEDPLAREFLSYVVSCALPKNRHVDLEIGGVDYRFDGQLGLAPTWGDEHGTCNADCVGAVSACVIARLNFQGTPTPISLRGGVLTAPPPERSAYPRIDGTYYGNVFTDPQTLYACLPPGVTELTRVCGAGSTTCPVTIVGSCTQVCDAVRADGAYPNCRDANVGTPGATAFKSAMTVFLK